MMAHEGSGDVQLELLEGGTVRPPEGQQAVMPQDGGSMQPENAQPPLRLREQRSLARPRSTPRSVHFTPSTGDASAGRSLHASIPEDKPAPGAPLPATNAREEAGLTAQPQGAAEAGGGALWSFIRPSLAAAQQREKSDPQPPRAK